MYLGNIKANEWVTLGGLVNAAPQTIMANNSTNNITLTSAFAQAIPYTCRLAVALTVVLIQAQPVANTQRVDMSLTGSTPSSGLVAPTSIHQWKGGSSGDGIVSVPVQGLLSIPPNTTPVLNLRAYVGGGGVDVNLYLYSYIWQLIRLEAL